MLDQPNATGSALDIWHVRLANGETRALSLDELDAGFQAGWISETTMVLRAGGLQWAPLSAIAGLDEPMEAIPNSLAPLALNTVDVEVDEEVNAFRPRRGRKVLGFMTALVVVAGLGYAGLRARPALQHALAAPAPPPPVQPVSIPPAPVPAPPPAAVVTTVASAVPNALPASAPVAKTKAGRPAVKRAGGALRP